MKFMCLPQGGLMCEVKPIQLYSAAGIDFSPAYVFVDILEFDLHFNASRETNFHSVKSDAQQ